jgi:hypothetical protein
MCLCIFNAQSANFREIHMKYLSIIAFSLLSSNLWAAVGVSPVTIPEPETLFLFGIGVAALIFSRNKRK